MLHEVGICCHMNITDFSTSILFAVAILAGPACGEVAFVDGDTFDLNGVRIRLNDIDAPEYGQKCGSWKCGADALEALNTLVNSGPVTCQKMGDDGYGRGIARCSVLGRDIGVTMVSEGMAYAFVKYSADYVAEEKQARSMKTGPWRGDFQKFWEYRAKNVGSRRIGGPGLLSDQGQQLGERPNLSCFLVSLIQENQDR